jgi:hypothetical protein
VLLIDGLPAFHDFRRFSGVREYIFELSSEIFAAPKLEED